MARTYITEATGRMSASPGAPVCPKAKTVALKPASAASAMGRPTASNTAAWSVPASPTWSKRKLCTASGEASPGLGARSAVISPVVGETWTHAPVLSDDRTRTYTPIVSVLSEDMRMDGHQGPDHAQTRARGPGIREGAPEAYATLSTAYCGQV